MLECGYVLRTKGDFVEVRIERNSACGQCGKCGMTEKQKHVDFFVQNTVSAKEGDTVELDIPEANSAKLAFVGYIIPLVPALVLLFVSVALSWAEWLSILLFFVGLSLGLVAVAIIDKVRKRQWSTAPKLTKIIVTNQKEINLKGENNE